MNRHLVTAGPFDREQSLSSEISALLESHCTTFANVRATSGGGPHDPNETLSARMEH